MDKIKLFNILVSYYNEINNILKSNSEDIVLYVDNIKLKHYIICKDKSIWIEVHNSDKKNSSVYIIIKEEGGDLRLQINHYKRGLVNKTITYKEANRVVAMYQNNWNLLIDEFKKTCFD